MDHDERYLDGEMEPQLDERTQEDVVEIREPEPVSLSEETEQVKMALSYVASDLATVQAAVDHALALIQSQEAQLDEAREVPLSEEESREAYRIYRELNAQEDPYAVDKTVEAIISGRATHLHAKPDYTTQLSPPDNKSTAADQ